MKKLLIGSIVLFGLWAASFGVPVLAQTAAGTPVGVREPGASAVVASNISVELTQSLNSKNAKVGDSVIANTRSAARISNGTMLPKGTKLMGKVTEVQAKGGGQRDGHVAFLFDHAVLRDGQQVPIRATLRSISGPAMVAPNGDTDGMLDGGGGAGMGGRPGSGVGAGNGVGAGGRSPGGLGGGGLAGQGASGGLSGAGSGVGSGLGPGRDVTGDAGGAMAGVDRSGVGLVDQTAGVSGSGSVGIVPVMNLPGVTAASSANVTGVVHASGRNVELNGGTQMVLAVTAN